MDLSNLSLGLAFLAGLASFLSPCVFSLVPAYVGYLGGRSAASAVGGQENRWLTLSHGLAFVLGFSVVFMSLGLAASALGGLLFDLRFLVGRLGGLVVIVFGLHMTGLVRIPFLEYDLRPQSTPDRQRGYLASFMMGIFFSAGWSPCIGPVLGSILTIPLSSGSVSQGVLLLGVYSAGLAIPFLIASTQIGLVTQVIRRYGRMMRAVEFVMGVILIIVGVLLLSGRFATLAGYGAFLGSYDEAQIGKVLLAIFLGLVVAGLLPAAIARSRGRNFFDWWFFGAGLFPIALVMALRLEKNPGPPAYPEALNPEKEHL